MPRISLPFLYQTRTIQHALRLVPFTRAVRLAHSAAPGEERRDNSIPFDWQDDLHNDFTASPSSAQSTITPSEAEIFKGIFDEISQGRIPATTKRPPTHLSREQSNAAAASTTVSPDVSANSIADHARVSDFRGKFLSRYPMSLRNAAQVALGLFEVPSGENGDTSVMDLKEVDSTGFAERAKFDELLSEKQARVEDLMEQCSTDFELWTKMEEEVFTLPKRLGISPSQLKSASGKGATETREAKDIDKVEEANEAQGFDELDEIEEANLARQAAKEHSKRLKKARKWAAMSEDEQKEQLEREERREMSRKYMAEKMKKKSERRQAKKEEKEMKAQALLPKLITDRQLLEIYGRLYPHFINKGLNLFDTKFARSSPYAFMILPRLRELGLPSYVLGISTPFFTKLASLYWTRYGDSNSAISVLNEMLQTGLYANKESEAVIDSIRDHVHGCAGGSQGPFVMAMMASAPYDANFAKRLDSMHQSIRTSIHQEAHDRA